MKIVAVVQARMGSTRLPDKVMMRIGNIPMIELLLSRLSKSEHITQVVVATSKNKNNLPLIDHVQSLGYEVYCGSENDVLSRYYNAAKQTKADLVIRITGDCPVIDSSLVDEVIEGFLNNKADYASNREPPTYPDGLDVEVISIKALEKAYKKAKEDFEREHVTPYIYLTEKENYNLGSCEEAIDNSQYRLTLDESSDYEAIKEVYKRFNNKIDFDYDELIELLDRNPYIKEINCSVSQKQIR